MSAPALLMLLAVGLSPAGPRSLALRTEVFAPEARPYAEDVEAFVTARVEESWGLAPILGDAQFTVTLAWAAREQVRIQIRDRDQIWVDRPLPVDDPAAARAMVWLLVRSTVERVLLRARVVEEDPTPAIASPAPAMARPTSAGAPDPGSGVAVEALDPDAEDDWLASPPPPVETTSVAAPAPPPEPPPAAAPAVRPSPSPEGLSRLWRAPFALAPGERVAAALVMRGFADPSSGFGWGPALSARLELANHAVFGGEISYRSERPSDALDVDHVPLTLLAGYVFQDIPLELGGTTSLDLRAVSTRHAEGGATTENSGVAAGLTLGAYARAFYPLYSKDSSELRLVADMGLRFALLRSAYVVADVRQEDAVVNFSTGLGVEWRWR